jgi:hypothetical protein
MLFDHLTKGERGACCLVVAWQAAARELKAWCYAV